MTAPKAIVALGSQSRGLRMSDEPPWILSAHRAVKANSLNTLLERDVAGDLGEDVGRED